MKKKIGEILLEKGFITEKELGDALVSQSKNQNQKIGSILREETSLTIDNLFNSLQEQSGFKFFDEKDLEKADLVMLEQFPIFLAKRYMAIPLCEENNKLVVVTSSNEISLLFNQLYLIYGKTAVPFLVNDIKIMDIINNLYSRVETADKGLNAEEFKEMSAEDDTSIPDLIDSNDEAPIIRFVNNTIARAAKDRVSDIHFESFEDEVLVRFRKDGKLNVFQRVPKAAQAGLITRLKIMGKLNISEKRLPQDGNIKVRIAGNDIDLRLSTLPSTHGESVVLRILDKKSQKLSLDASGFTSRDLKTMRELINKKHGIFLVCGPTGSGKTTTLYSALTEINSPDVKIITEEDPVEIQLKGINQIHINSKIGLTFAHGLRSILRQDPDIIMVGEIRDKDTADIAIQAALTGHLVLSTIHTNDAPSVFTRLTDMGVEPFLLTSTIVGVLAQRLVRILCPHCKKPYHPEPAILEDLGLDPHEYESHIFYRAEGCDLCRGIGYQGRTGIFELIKIDDDMRRAVVNRSSSSDIKKIASSSGMLTLREDGALKAVKGITSPDEILRVTQEDS